MKKRRIKHQSEFRVALSYLVRNKMAVVGIAILSFILFLAIFANFVAPYDPISQDIMNTLSPPSTDHLFGTDEFGRDLLSRIIYGSRSSLTVAGLVVATSGVIGTLLGAVSAYFGGKLDNLIMRSVDIFMSIPDIILAIAIMAVIGPGIINLVIAMSATYWTRWARLVRSEVLTLRDREYIQAAKVCGAGDADIIFTHVLPNVLHSVIVIGTMTMAGSVLYEAALSFIGLGVPPPAPSWGSMLAGGREFMFLASHILIYPGIAITLTTLGFYLVGDGLRDALDPRLRTD